MTDGTPGETPRSEVREAAREQARELRERHRKNDRRRRWIIQGGILVVMVAIVAIVVLVLQSVADTPARGPQNMLSDGIRIGQDYEAVRTPALGPDARPVASETSPPDVVDIRVYVDYLCENCGRFEQRNSDQLRAWIESGVATVEIHPLAILTSKSTGTKYSLRAANAAACVAEYSPDRFFDFNEALFRDQPEEGSEGLTDQELLARASAADVTNMPQVTRCVTELRFKSWVKAATARALNGPLPGTEVPAVTGPLTILVNGNQFNYTTAFDPDEFAQFVLQALGESFNENPTPAPSPSETETAEADE